ncbi:MAG: phosphotransferase [Psychromonas sp.]
MTLKSGFQPALQSVEQFKHALTNQVFLLTFKNKQQVIFKRLNLSARGKTERIRELNVQRMLSAQELTPKVLASCDEYKLQEFMPGQLLTEVSSEYNVITLLAQQLQIIHQSPALHAQPQRLAYELEKLKALLKVKIDEDKFQQILLLAIELDTNSPKNILCHGDLSLNNILLTTNNDIKILDWEYASLACAAYDVASCISINQLDKTSQQHLIEKYYFLNPNAVELSYADFKKQCIHYLLVFNYLDELWQYCFIEQPL